CFYCIFFFSSRRRHTRWPRDWSSDVCSSDLWFSDKEAESLNQAVQEFRKVLANYSRADKASTALYKEALALIELKQPQQAAARRSEERRVGKEWRAGGLQDDEQEKE